MQPFQRTVHPLPLPHLLSRCTVGCSHLGGQLQYKRYWIASNRNLQLKGENASTIIVVIVITLPIVTIVIVITLLILVVSQMQPFSFIQFTFFPFPFEECLFLFCSKGNHSTQSWVFPQIIGAILIYPIYPIYSFSFFYQSEPYPSLTHSHALLRLYWCDYFATNAGGATWWPNLREKSSFGLNSWVRCASGNVF